MCPSKNNKHFCDGEKNGKKKTFFSIIIDVFGFIWNNTEMISYWLEMTLNHYEKKKHLTAWCQVPHVSPIVFQGQDCLSDAATHYLLLSEMTLKELLWWLRSCTSWRKIIFLSTASETPCHKNLFIGMLREQCCCSQLN